MSALGPGSCSGCGIEVPLYAPMFFLERVIGDYSSRQT
jgi:hypothetical protein